MRMPRGRNGTPERAAGPAEPIPTGAQPGAEPSLTPPRRTLPGDDAEGRPPFFSLADEPARKLTQEEVDALLAALETEAGAWRRARLALAAAVFLLLGFLLWVVVR